MYSSTVRLRARIKVRPNAFQPSGRNKRIRRRSGVTQLPNHRCGRCFFIYLFSIYFVLCFPQCFLYSSVRSFFPSLNKDRMIRLCTTLLRNFLISCFVTRALFLLHLFYLISRQPEKTGFSIKHALYVNLARSNAMKLNRNVISAIKFIILTMRLHIYFRTLPPLIYEWVA